jgi:uncharacterized protein YcfL
MKKLLLIILAATTLSGCRQKKKVDCREVPQLVEELKKCMDTNSSNPKAMVAFTKKRLPKVETLCDAQCNHACAVEKMYRGLLLVNEGALDIQK